MVGRKTAAAIVLLGLALALFLCLRPVQRRRPQRQTISLRSLPAEYFERDIADICERGNGILKIFRFTAPVEFVPEVFEQHGFDVPVSAAAWRERLDVSLVLNAGQFDAQLRHLGWLKRSGRWLSPERKPAWKAVLASGPIDEAYWARIIDLDRVDDPRLERYQHVVQSMMLVDERQQVRVRSSDKAASRTVVAEDTSGRILLLFTEGAVRLAALAERLPTLDLQILRAMNLDGGGESQFSLSDPALVLEHTGNYGVEPSVLRESSGGLLRSTLPVVLAVRPKKSIANLLDGISGDP